MKPFLTIVFLLLTTLIYSQTVEIEIHKNRIRDFMIIEQRLESEKLENKSTYILQKGVAQPILFKRKQSNLPDLIVSYFYFEKDSSISSILYEWDDKTVNGQNPNKTPKEINDFINHYTNLFDQVSKKFGDSKSTGNMKDLSKIETGDFKKTDLWSPNDSTKVELYMILSSRYEKRGNTTINPTYRVRLEIKNQGKTNEPFGKPDENKIKRLDSIFRLFLVDIQNKNYDNAKLSLSDLIIKDVTNEQLEMLRKNIKFNDDLIIFMSGVQLGFDGTSYFKFQYQYKSDTNTPPKELVNVTFDEKNKIAALQPTKRL